MRHFQIGIISGKNGRFYFLNIEAENEKAAREIVLDVVGRTYKNQITVVWEV